ncbi:Chromatin-remodeling complex subunit ies6 [Penicillium canariense]|uniref:Chromatin-remodeling complex subunit ies6 n=1 Tax=Penicillium canariense TaxID=189055 RepID=A0A9W9HPR5_9EURO|nr:Chromatin-remodeling complex subunit ies6 [Penicillium canariense]KAJ5152625.1 Chromatin-remodeling complex subunit ies6 [Penicillium canariense]
MPPATPAKDDEAHQLLLSQLDIAAAAKPFRNAHWKPSQRRNKNVKAIISETTRKEASQMATQANSGATTPFAGTSGVATSDGSRTPAESAGKAPNIAQAAQNLSTLVLEKNARAMFPSGPAVTYTNIESAPSLDPSHQRHYCDITGLSGPYTDPKTRLRYHNKEIFGVIRSLAQGVPESYLEARGAHTVLK